MDIVKLRTLREFADRGSLSAAARALYCTPSAVSQQIRSLQSEVGVALTEPAGRGMRLTDAGWALVARADEVLAALDRAESELDTYRSSPRGTVRMAIFPSGGQLLLPGLLRGLEDYERLHLDVRDIDMTPPEVSGLLADFDIVVTHREEYAEPFDSERVSAVPLLREPLDIVLPPGHPLESKDRLELADLAGERWIGVGVGFPVDDVLRSLALRTGVRPEVTHRINDFRITEELVTAGHGVALLPRYSVDTAAGRVSRRPIAGIRSARHIEAALRPGARSRPAVETVLDCLRTQSEQLTDG